MSTTPANLTQRQSAVLDEAHVGDIKGALGTIAHLTEAVQTLAGVLLPSATVFLLLLCNDKAVLGPWVNSTKVNVFTGTVFAVLVVLSIIITAATVYPDISGAAILKLLVVGCAVGAVIYATVELSRKLRGGAGADDELPLSRTALKESRNTWRMPPLQDLPAPQTRACRRACGWVCCAPTSSLRWVLSS